MSNWQNWAVALILLLCIVRIGQRVYAFFMKVREKRNPCENCATGCELVSGLQNRVRRFESARNLNNPSQIISERDFLLGTLGTSIV